jgi:Ca2+-transporting ATPase
MSAEQAAQRLGVDAAHGLTEAEARSRLAQSGPNELEEPGGRAPLQILIEQLTGILTFVLFGAALVSVFLQEYIDAVVILLIVAVNAALGFAQEYRAEQTMAALKRMSLPKARVRREGRVHEISARDLVPGDVVLLETGNVVPADGRVLLSVNLRATEAALTGESEPVDKDPNLVFGTDRALGDRRNMVYMGTVINYGRGEILVTATGMRTELGHIATLIQSVEAEQTPLQRRLDRLGKLLAMAALVIVAVIFALGVLQGNPVEEMLLTAVSLAVAAIPEALTAVVTIALSLGAQRMLKRNALIRKLPAVETLGSVNVICSDKTGTLTQNRMTVVVLDVANKRIDLMQQQGRRSFDKVVDDRPEAYSGLRATLDLLLLGGALCNDAVLNRDAQADPLAGGPAASAPSASAEGRRDGSMTAIGDPTEAALVLAAAQFSIYKDELDRAFPRIAELPFDSTRKRMTTLHRVPKSKGELPESLVPLWERSHERGEEVSFTAITKGAVEGLLEMSCDVWVEGELHALDETWRARVMQAHDGLAQNGMRVLGLGARLYDHTPSQGELEGMERDLIFLGMFGLIDPPRPEVLAAIARCNTAGIRTVMITGDHPLTAQHIARQLGMCENDSFLTGQELDKLSPEELVRAAQDVSVFARVSPEHKLKLVDIYRSLGKTVAMTGDGVNDAPALKKADIGIAMGITGTDVSKEAAEIVLLDDNFATIVAAVEEGRIIYDNIRRFIKYLLTCNASEIAVMLFGPFLLSMSIPLLPLQILWMNLVTDGLPALALGVEPGEENVMKRPPYSSSQSIFGRGMVAFIIGLGLVMSLVALGVGYWSYQQGSADWQSLLFTTLILSQLMLALEARSEQNSLFHIRLFSNPSMVWAVLITAGLQLSVLYVPLLRDIFKTTALELGGLGIAVAASFTVLVAAEVWKWVLRQR